MKRQFKQVKYFIVLSAVFAGSFLLSAGGGGGGKGPNNCKTCPTPDPPCNTMNCNLILPLHLNVQNITGRNPAYANFEPQSNILNGLQTASTPNLSTNPHMNYCSITITSSGCTGYGNSNVKTYIWDSANNGNQPGMKIEIPAATPFTLTVEIYEGCGMYYIQNPLKRRAKYKHSSIWNPNSTIILQDTQFSLINAPEC